ncbi:hypothetical protein L3V79_07735 [Thiotrichales bacterium 19S9-12]|nr:hypothetical protein [Thiotrichales bacterium 19S9-11]MCF6812243.1 hypothetical protein [Thiotrichales bacterium 19S9-12]
MSRFISLLFTILLAGFIGVVLVQSQGMLILTISGYMIETPLWFAVLSVIIIGFLAVIVVKAIKGTLYVPFQFSMFFIKRKRKKALESLRLSILAVLSGDYDLLSDKRKTKNYHSLKSFGFDDVGLLMEAISLLKTNRIKELKLLLSSLPHKLYESEFILWVRSELLLQENKQTEAYQLLSDARGIFPQSKLIYHAFIDASLAEGRFVKVLALLEEGNSHRMLSQHKLDSYYERAILSNLEQLKVGNAVTVSEFWSTVPNKYKKHDKIYLKYIEVLIKTNQSEKAEGLLKKLLKKAYAIRYLALWSELVHVSAKERLNFIESQFKGTQLLEEDQVKFICAKLAVEAAEYDQAKSLLESLPRNTQIDALLANVYYHLNMHHKAVSYYQKAVGQEATAL